MRTSRHLISSISTVRAIYPNDIIADLNNYLKGSFIPSFYDFTTLQNKINDIFQPFYNKNIVICAPTADYNGKPTHVSSYYGTDHYFNVSFSLRSSVDNAINAFTINMKMTINMLHNVIEITGGTIYNNEVSGNYILQTQGRKSIYHTHGGSGNGGSWYNIEKGEQISGLANYLAKRYEKRISENLQRTKELKIKIRTREIYIDDVRAICDLINQHNDKFIFAHFYDAGKNDLEDKFYIVVNNRSDYQDLPRMTYECYDCNRGNPPAALASLKYFSSNECIKFCITKCPNHHEDVLKEWRCDITWPAWGKFSEYINRNEFGTKYYVSLADMAETLNNLIEKDMVLCNKMDQIWD